MYQLSTVLLLMALAFVCGYSLAMALKKGKGSE